MNFFQKTAIGLAIADHAVEAVELVRGEKPVIRARGRVELEPDIVARGRIKDQKKLFAAARKAFDEAKPASIRRGAVVVGLPEPQTYLHVFETAAAADSAITAEIASSIPIPPDDLVCGWRVMRTARDTRTVLAVGASARVVKEWHSFCESLGLDVNFFDIEILAIFRNVFREYSKEPVLLLDIGAATTTISIFGEYGLAYTRSVYIAGQHITGEIAMALKIQHEDADARKKTVGLAKREDPIFFALVRALEPIVREVRGAIEYFAKASGKRVVELVLVGGSSRMPGLDEYFSINIGLPVKVVGSPEAEIEAVGFALRALEERWEKADPSLPVSSV